MVILRLLFVTLSGFGLHQAYAPTRALGERWGGMLREAIGVLGMFPGFILIRDGLEHRDGIDSLTIAYLLTAFSFGTGVLCGHLADKKPR